MERERLSSRVLQHLQSEFDNTKVDDAIKLLQQDNRPSMSI